MLARIACLVALLASAACNRPPDPLAEHRTTCEKLQKAGQLKKDLTLEVCAQKLKAVADASDPRPKIDEVLSRISTLSSKARGAGDDAGKAAVRAASDELARLGKPAIKPALAKLESSIDPDFRLAVARGLVGACKSDCASGEFSCIVPALLEGAGADKPAKVRADSGEALRQCTGQAFGDEPAAWNKWFAEWKQRGASQAAR